MTVRKGIEISTYIGTALLVGLLVWFWSQGYFSNPQALQMLFRQAGFIGPLLFIVVQIVRVIIPIIPGGLTSAIGVMAFGPFL